MKNSNGNRANYANGYDVPSYDAKGPENIVSCLQDPKGYLRHWLPNWRARWNDR